MLAINFGYGTVSTYRLAERRLSLLQDPASEAIPGDGTFRAVNGLVSSGPSDSWLTPDDQYFHQIFGNASVLVSYRLDKTSGKLTEIGRNAIPTAAHRALWDSSPDISPPPLDVCGLRAAGRRHCLGHGGGLPRFAAG